MSKAILLILLFTGWFLLLLLLYWNRSSPRILEAATVIAIAILGALIFVTKGESITKNIRSVYFINNKEHTLMFFDSIPVLGQHFLCQRVIFDSYQKRLSKQKEHAPLDFISNHKPLIDLQARTILYHLSTWYSQLWNLVREDIESVVGKGKTFQYFKKEDVGNDIIIYNRKSLPHSLKKNMFYEEIIHVPINIALPKGTKFYYTSKEGKNAFCEYRFHKPLSFDIRIKINFSAYTIGLGRIGDYLGVTNIEAPCTNMDDENVKNYGHFILHISCKAEFSRIRAWNPTVIKYKEWVSNIFEDLYTTYDWSLCINELKDYRKDVAIQRIIDNR